MKTNNLFPNSNVPSPEGNINKENVNQENIPVNETKTENASKGESVTAKDNTLPVAANIEDDIDELFPVAENRELISENLKLPLIKIMKDSCTFYIESLDITLKALDVIIVNNTAPNALWIEDEENEYKNLEVVGTQIPDCYSADGNTANSVFYSTNSLCEDCKFNQYKSIELIGKPGKGKACKNMYKLAVYLLDSENKVETFTALAEKMSGIPYTLTLPPTSKKSYNDFVSKCSHNSTPVMLSKARITLEKKSDAANHNYAVTKIEMIGNIKGIFTKKEEIEQYKKHTIAIKKMLLNTKITSDDCMQDEEAF